MSDSSNLQDVLALCDEALTRPETERADFLDMACANNPELRREVDALLNSVSGSAAFLEPAQSAPSLIGEQIGDYRILERLGEGGMGAVFLAEREGGEFSQKVALKLVRRYMINDELVQRFDSERQILAGLNHPYIAQLIDGGTTHDGVPYLVMEYVEGTQIDRYCDERRLDVKQRIVLLQKVAKAVQAAHQNLIVHRDLKPANVLITHDGIPKLLDFGIAKLVDPARQAQHGHTTIFGHTPMTPDYSSPEQIIEGKVTTAGDIYSLGILAYELLSGERPYELSSGSHPQLIKSVEALTIRKPSERITRPSDPQTQTNASRRATQPQQLVRQLAGDLDRIVLKALHRDPARRYESVGAFAKDLERYLQGLPVEARDDTLSYRMTKFVKRNRLMVGAATVTMLAVVAGLGLSLWQAGIARDQSLKAQAQLARAEAVSGFLGDVLLAPSVNWDGALQTGPNATIVDVLAAAETKLDSELGDYPEVRLELYNKMSVALAAIESYDSSLRLQLKALALAEQTLSDRSPLLVDTYYHVAVAYSEVDDHENAERYYRLGLDTLAQQTDEPNLRKLYLLNDLAQLASERHDFPSTITLMHQAIDDSHIVLGDALQPAHSLGYANLGTAYLSSGQFEQARQFLATALEAHRLYPEQTKNIGALINERFARLAIIAGDIDAALDHYSDAMTAFDELLGVPNPMTAETKMRVARLTITQNEVERRSLDDVRQQLDYVETHFRDRLDSPAAWSYFLTKGHLRLFDGQAEEALRLVRTSLDKGYAIEMSRFDRTDAKFLLVRALTAGGKTEEARTAYRELIDVESAWIPDDTPYKQRLLSLAL